MVERGLTQRPQAIVRGALQFEHLRVGLQQRNGREEATALKPILIQARGGHVGGGHQGHAAGKERVEELTKNHGIGDVGDKKLVEANHARALSPLLRDMGQGVRLACVRPKRLVNPTHEPIEVHALADPFGQGLKKQIHEEGLTSTNPPPKVEPPQRRCGAVASAKASPKARGRRSGRQRPGQRV